MNDDALDVGFADMTGTKLRPAHFQYRVDGCESNRLVYAVGAFGNGEGLKPGTGYAVMEIVNSDFGKAVGKWERYKPEARESQQIVMVNTDEARKYFGCETPEEARGKYLCWICDTDALISGDKAWVGKAMKELEVAGWEF